MKLKYTKPQIILEIIGAIIMIGLFVFVGIKYQALPDQIPKHFNASGQIDAWGSKASIWSLPGVGAFLYILLTVITFFPSTWNFPTTKMTEKNKIPLYQLMKTFLIITKIELLASFAYITLFTIKGTSMSSMFIFVLFAALILTGLFFWELGRMVIKKY